MAIIFESAQVAVKKQPVVSGLGVASFADQNPGLLRTRVNTPYMNEAKSNVL
jgi:hypothetical protein